MKQVAHLFNPAIKGIAEIDIYNYDHKKDLRGAFQFMKNPQDFIQGGNYVRLLLNGKTVMSDTNMEMITNREFVHKANGNVLIAGLGIGLIIHNIMDKVNDGTVIKILVIEKYQDVIDLIAPKFNNEKIEIIQADIFEYKSDEKWDTIYFDIWADRCVDNLDEIKKLHNKWKFKLNRKNPDCYMNSWYKEELQDLKRRDR